MFLGSIALNVILIDKIISYYKANNLLRLDPLETNALINNSKNIATNKKNRLILMFGDSRIANWRPKLTMPGWTVINQGIRGQTTSQLMLRLHNDVLAYSPDIVILQAGINDLKNIGLFPKGNKSIVENCRKNLFYIIDQLAAERIQIIVLTIFPTGKPNFIRTWFWSSETNSTIMEINTALKSAHKNHVQIFDAYDLLSDGDYIRSDFKRDMLHLNYNGYVHLNEKLQSFISHKSAQPPKK